MKRKKLILIVVLALVCALGAAFGVKALFFSAEERTALTEQTTFGSLGSTIEGTATTFPGNSSTISAASSDAKITAVYVSAGDTVSVGDRLYDQDDSEVDDKLEEYQKEVDSLYDQIDSYEDQIDSYNEQIENSREQIDDYNEQIAELRDTIASLTVTAPFSGRVQTLHTDEGSNAQKGASLVTLVDDSAMTLTEYVSYAYEDRVAVGMEAGVSVAALGLNLKGTVTELRKVRRVTEQGTVCFAVTIQVENPGALTQGMTAAGYLLTDSGEKIYPAIEGTLDYAQSKTITAPAAAEVLAVNVAEYEAVSRGRVLVTLSEETYLEQIEKLNDSITSANKSIENAKKSIERANSNISDTQDRIATYLERMAESEESRADYQVTSDIDGTVIMVTVKEGETPRQGMTAVSIYNQDVMTITANIDEEDMASIEKGMEVAISATAGNFVGTVSEISYEATSSNGVAYFPITIEIPSDGRLSAGVSVSYTITTGDAQEGVLVPLAALKTTDSGTCVFLQSDSKPASAADIDVSDLDIPDGFYPILVTVEAVSGQYARISEDLEEGSQLFTRYQNAAPSGGDTTSQGDSDGDFSFPEGMGGGGFPSGGGGFSGGGGGFSGGGGGGGMPSMGGNRPG